MWKWTLLLGQTDSFDWFASLREGRLSLTCARGEEIVSEERPVRQYNEKQEKQHEKEEKSWEEKWRRDPLNAAAWAVIIIWLGLVLLASQLGFFEDSLLDAWPLFFVGAGVILLLEVAARLVLPAYRTPFMGNVVLAIIFLAIGLGGLINWNLIWAFALIGLGCYVLLRGLFGQRGE